MSLFRDLGRQAERLKQRVQSAADAPHECDDCDALYEEPKDRCPECGSEAVVPIERE